MRKKKAMSTSTTPLGFPTVFLLCLVQCLCPSITATPAPAAYETTELSNIPDVSVTSWPDGEVSTTRSYNTDTLDVTGEPFITTSTAIATGTPLAAGPAVDGSLQLACPDRNPDLFLSTSWFLITGKEDVTIKAIGLYRVDRGGAVTKYRDKFNVLLGMSVTHNVTGTKALMI